MKNNILLFILILCIYNSNTVASYPEYKPNSFIIAIDNNSSYFDHELSSNIEDINGSTRL